MCLVPFFFCNLHHIFLDFLVCILVDAQLVLYLLFGFTPVDTDNRPHGDDNPRHHLDGIGHHRGVQVGEGGGGKGEHYPNHKKHTHKKPLHHKNSFSIIYSSCTNRPSVPSWAQRQAVS